MAGRALDSGLGLMATEDCPREGTEACGREVLRSFGALAGGGHEVRFSAIKSVGTDRAVVVGPDKGGKGWSENTDVAAGVEVARRAAGGELCRGKGDPFVARGAGVLFMLDQNDAFLGGVEGNEGARSDFNGCGDGGERRHVAVLMDERSVEDDVEADESAVTSNGGEGGLDSKVVKGGFGEGEIAFCAFLGIGFGNVGPWDFEEVGVEATCWTILRTVSLVWVKWSSHRASASHASCTVGRKAAVR